MENHNFKVRYTIYFIYPLVMTNIAIERSTMFKNGKPVNHLFLWAVYTMAMLNNHRVIGIHGI
jgi:hypothetical protein